jgi:hypothetical protein
MAALVTGAVDRGSNGRDEKSIFLSMKHFIFFKKETDKIIARRFRLKT